MTLDLRELVASTPAEELAALGGRLREAELLVEARLRAVPSPAPSREDANISVAEAAKRLGVSMAWLYKNAKALPFVVRIGRRLVCVPSRLDRWNRARMTA